MKFTKLLCLFLALALCFLSLAACGGDEKKKSDQTDDDGGILDLIIDDNDEATTDDNIPDAKPEQPKDDGYENADFNGEDFVILNLVQAAGARDYYGGNFLDSEGLTGDTISDSVYMRNLKVEEKYNVNIVENKIDLIQFGSPAEVLQSYYMAGDFTFDAIYGWGYRLGALIPENYFADISALPYVDLKADYWNPSVNENLYINDSLYIFTNAVSMNSIDWASMLFFNKDLLEDFDIDSKFGSPYDLVRDGKWTVDTFLQMVTSVSMDVDGDGKITEADKFGILEPNSSPMALASGIETVKRNGDGTFSLSYYSEKTVDLATRLNNVFTNKNYSKSYEDFMYGDMTGYNDMWEYTRSFFPKGHCLFLTGSPSISSELRNMEADYGILPLPKYDEAQKDYISPITELASLFAIPTEYNQQASTAGPERTGMILEYMAYQSEENLLPTYYDKLIKGKVDKDPNNLEMLEIIRNGATYDFCAVMSVSPDIDMDRSEIVMNFQEILSSPQTASSRYRRVEVKYQKALDKFYTDCLNLKTKE